MPAQKSAFKQWLRLQCQMIATTSAGVLIQHHGSANDQVMARWPERETTPAGLMAVAKETIKKQRLHLQPNDQDLLLGQPLMIGGQLWGVLVLRLEKRTKRDMPAILKQIQGGITWLQFLLHQQDERIPEPAAPAMDILELLASVLREPSLGEAAITLVNKLASRLKSERVSLGLCDKRGVDVLAVSFSANFDKRTQEMQSVANAMTEAVEQRQDIHYIGASPTGAATDTTGVILRCHEQLQQTKHSAGVHTFLLRRSQQVIGAITLETPASAPLTADSKQWVEQNLAFIAPIFYLRQSASISSGQALKSSALSFLQRWFGPRHLLGKVMSSALLALCVVALIPGDYWVYSDAVLENTNKHVLVAPQDGYLGAINARPGDAVSREQVLAQLNDDDLTLERRKLASQVQQYRQEYDSALATSNRSQAAIASAQVEQASVQLRLIEQQLARTRLTAPIDGVIVSDDIRQSLGAPVKQGEVLFEIASAEGYLVQLYVDERDITAIANQQSGRLSLTSLPGQILDFTVTHITPVSEVREGRNYFRVEAELTSESPLIRPGMTGSGRILAGRRSLGWIWFHDIWHWLRLTLWV